MKNWMLVATAVAFVAGCEVKENDSNSCVPLTCEGRGDDCVTLDDGCGNALTCGTCVAPGQLAFRVDQARQPRTNGKAESLHVVVTLFNGEGGQPVLLSAAFFRLKLANGLLKMPRTDVQAENARWVDGRVPNPTDSLAGNASYARWLLAFDNVDAQADQPQELIFEVPGVSAGGTTVGDGRKASASVSVEACTTCGSTCTYLDRDLQNCGSCGTGPDGSQQMQCSAGELRCTGPDQVLCAQGGPGTFACVNTKTSLSHCGACGVAVPREGRCDRGVPTCGGKSMIEVSGACVDTRTDVNNCGSAGYDCTDLFPENATSSSVFWPQCRAGRCDGWLDYVGPPNGTCTQSCASLGYACIDLSSDRGDLGAAHSRDGQSSFNFYSCDTSTPTLVGTAFASCHCFER